jgi:hypothetical protein
VVPRAWDTGGATLTAQKNGGAVILADYGAVPCSLVMNSSATPKGGVTSRVVIADGKDALDALDGDALHGKILLTRLAPNAALSKARDGGALGIVSDCMPLFPGIRDSREDAYDASVWDNGFQTAGDAGLFAFCLSPRNGDLLREMLRADPALTLRAEVDARRYDGEVHTVSGLLPGTDPGAGEVLIYGHLYEPGAHDNASGCGLILELAFALSKLPRMKRGVRFAMGWECTGSMGFIQERPAVAARTVCAIVADMVGSTAKSNAVLSIWHNPLSNGSYTDGLINDILGAYNAYSGFTPPLIDKPFNIGSDNIVGDPCFGIPTVAMIMHPALSYHSSMDGMALIEPETLCRSGMVAGAFLCYMAGAGADSLPHLSALIPPALDSLAGRSAYAKALLSLERLLTPDNDAAPDGWRRVPKRLVPGCLTFEKWDGYKDFPYKAAWNTALHLPLFWADGTRNLWQIAALSASEAGKTDVRAHYDETAAFFEFLAEKGYLCL